MAQAVGIEPRKIGLTLQSPCNYWLHAVPSPIYFARWFRDGQIVFIGGLLNKARREGDQCMVDEISVSIVIALRDVLPAGAISSTMTGKEVFSMVARSFGEPTNCDERKPYVPIYEGPWDGRQPRCRVDDLQSDLMVFADFNRATSTCRDVWTFSLTKYLKWWHAGIE
jgi:hypothetical protein